MTSDSDLTQWLRNELFHQIPLNAAVIDRDLNIVEANKSFEMKFGEWRGKKCYEVFKKRNAPCGKCIAKLTFEDGECHVDDELGLDLNDNPVQYVLNTAPIRNGGGKIEYVIEMVKDVTEARTVERDYQILFQRVPNFVAVMDREYRIVRANEKFRATFGENCIGKFCYNVYKKRDSKCEDCPAALTFQDGNEHGAEQEGITSDGERNKYVVHTAPLGRRGEKFAHVIEISTDITRIRRLQQELSKLHDFQDALIKNSLDPVIATDETHRLILFNPAAEQLLGYSADRMRGRSWMRLLPGEFRKIIQEGGDICFLPEVELLNKRREKLLVRFVGVALKERGRIIGSAVFLQDLTELKKLEAGKLEAERLAAVGKTVAGLAHGVKNILTGIEGGMYVMNTGFQKNDSERIFNGWDMLRRNIEKITIFTKDFLSFSKGEQPHLEFCSPSKIARDVYGLFHDAAEQSQVVFSADITEIPNAYFDADGLHACLSNLVSNGIDACQMSEKESKTVILRAFEKGGKIVFEAEDNGVGMDYEIKKKVFTNFFTTKGTKGTGIGLLTTRKIVVQHGGDIKMDSEVGKGSVFSITFDRMSLENRAKAMQK